MARKASEKMQDATAALFDGIEPIGDPEEKPQEQDVKNDMPKEQSEEKSKSAKKKEMPVSIWLDAETRKKVKAMSQATGSSVSKIVSAAINQYIDQSALSKDQKTIYNAAIRLLSK